MNKELVTLIIKCKVEIDKFIKWEIFESATAGYNDITHFRVCDKGPIILIFWTTSKFWVNDIELIFEQ
jgi:hypothetical protein